MSDTMRAPMIQLGETGPTVPRLIFGTEHIIDLSPEEGGAILAGAYRQFGINHWDTAPIYESHPQVASGLKQAGRENILVTSKTRAETADEARQELASTLAELDIHHLDIAFLHNVTTDHLPRRSGALDYLVDARQEGLVGHVGISSHSPATLEASAGIPELEIVCGTLNRDGSRIDDGTLDEMIHALKTCYEAGKGVYVIKILGRGDLVDDVEGAIEFVCQYPFIHAYNIGMRNAREVEENLGFIIKHAPELR